MFSFTTINIELFYDKSNGSEFTQLVTELSPPGVLTQSTDFPFEFDNVEKQFESYNGLNVRLRYYVRVTVTRSYSSNIYKEQDFWVQCLNEKPEINTAIKMEVGIEDCLHIEFEYDKGKYNLKDVIIGKIYFLLVCIKIKHMEVTIIRRETAGQGQNATPGNDTVTKFEIMDGAPVRGESIPVRLFLEGFPLTPTYRNVNNMFSTRYYVNLVLVDEEDRRYFKQQEITLWRN
jgi:vacuolar protein sorting-associated protein 26